MSEPRSAWPKRLLGAVAIVAIAVAAFLTGMLTERLRFDSQRHEMLQRYDQALKLHQKQIMESEKTAEAAAGSLRSGASR
jgi:hypothetical protein